LPLQSQHRAATRNISTDDAEMLLATTDAVR
jgi:hypothetical protein